MQHRWCAAPVSSFLPSPVKFHLLTISFANLDTPCPPVLKVTSSGEATKQPSPPPPPTRAPPVMFVTPLLNPKSIPDTRWVDSPLNQDGFAPLRLLLPFPPHLYLRLLDLALGFYECPLCWLYNACTVQICYDFRRNLLIQTAFDISFQMFS